MNYLEKAVHLGEVEKVKDLINMPGIAENINTARNDMGYTVLEDAGAQLMNAIYGYHACREVLQSRFHSPYVNYTADSDKIEMIKYLKISQYLIEAGADI